MVKVQKLNQFLLIRAILLIIDFIFVIIVFGRATDLAVSYWPLDFGDTINFYNFFPET